METTAVRLAKNLEFLKMFFPKPPGLKLNKIKTLLWFVGNFFKTQKINMYGFFWAALSVKIFWVFFLLSFCLIYP